MTADVIATILNEHGPMLSSELARFLKQSHGLTDSAARKRVQRGCAGMTKLSHLVFPHRARFVYMQSEYGSPRFFAKLSEALQRSNSTYYHALKALELRSNIMPRSHFLIACGAPVAQANHVSAVTVADRLIKAGLVKEKTLPGGQVCIVRCDEEIAFADGDSIKRMKARLIAERIALIGVRDWARQLGFVSYDAVKTREDGEIEEMPRVGTFEWDMSGPCYLFPMRTYSTNAEMLPGFFVCDIALNGRVNAEEISAFVKKCITLRSLAKVGRCLQVFVAESYSLEALRQLRAEGIIPATTESLFGSDVAEALKSLCSLLIATTALIESPGALEEIFEGLSRIEGAASTLRGSLFEFAVAQIAKTTFLGCNAEVNRIVQDGLGRHAEIDVLAIVRNHEVVFIECKGVHPLSVVDDDEVVKWLDQRIPVLRGAAKQHSEWRDLRQRYEIWSSGGYTDKALSLIVERQQQTSKYIIEARDGDYIHAEVRASKDKGLIRTYEEHFINHPMLELKKAKERARRKAIRDDKYAQQPELALPTLSHPLPPRSLLRPD